MIDFHPETRLALDPRVRLKNDVDRAILITRPRPITDRMPFCAPIHPKLAVALALFDGDRTIADVTQLWARLHSKKIDRAKREMHLILETFSSLGLDRKGVLVEATEANREQLLRYDPMDFVIPKKNVNLTDFRLRKPYIIYFLPSMFCPQRCVYCYAKTSPKPESGDFISLERLREIFTELAEIGVEAIQFSGGDPLARRDIFEIIRSLHEVGILADIPTKIGLSYRRIQELRQLGVDSMQVSLDSSRPEVLDRMVGVAGYHERAFRLMDDLQLAGMRVRVNTVVTPVNIDFIPELVEYLGDLGNVYRLTLSPYTRSMFCHQDSLFVEPEELDDLNAKVQEVAKKHDSMIVGMASPTPPISQEPQQRKREWQTRAYCTANRQGFIILPDGKVTVCEELYDHPFFLIGDLKTQSIMEVWQSEKALSLLYPDQAQVPDGPCKSCKHFVACNSERGKCWRDALKTYGWAKPHYPDPRCPAAPAGVRLG